MNKALLWIVIIIVIVAGAYLLFWNTASAPSTPAANNTNGTPATITLTDSGFSPSSITVKKGQAVTWVNESTQAMWVASAPHPAHTGYDGASLNEHCAAGYAGPAPFDECAEAQTGGSYTFTFDKAGTWKYHNHLRVEETGTVIVTD